MAFDIKTFCYITDAFEKKGKFEADYRHGGLNIFYAAKGSCSVVSHGKILEMVQGDIICCDGTANLKCEAKTDDVYGINIVGTVAEKYGREIETAFVTNSLFSPFLPQQIMQVVKAYKSLSEIYLANTGFEIINALSHGDKTAVIANTLIIEAVQLIKERYCQPFGVEDLAQRLKISKSHLVREFFKYTGTTPGKYLTTVRIDAVKYLLATTSLSLNEIAARTGFSGDNYLCKSFKRATGETPVAYKQRVISSQYLPHQMTLQVDPEIYL